MTTRYLVDSNVLSEATRPAPNETVIEWLRLHEHRVTIDSIVLGELLVGVHSLAAGRRRSELGRWLDNVVAPLECLPWDAAVSRRWATLVADLRRRGRTMPLLDSMIAATALHHDLTVATRNVRDFLPSDVRLVDPASPARR